MTDSFGRLEAALTGRYRIERDSAPAAWRPCTAPKDPRHRRHIGVFKDPDPTSARQVEGVPERVTRVTGEPGGTSKR